MVQKYAAMALVAVAIGVASPAMAQLTFFDNAGDFAAFATGQGNVLNETETFEEHILGDNSISDGPAPVMHGVAWPKDPFPLIYPTGLDAENLVVGVPGDADRLVVITTGFFGAPSTVIGPDIFGNSTDLRFVNEDHFAIGFDAIDLANGPGTADVSIYDIDGILIDTTTMALPATSQQFFGVVSDVPIGHINVAGQNEGGELVDNVQMWVAVPEPASLAMLAIGAAGMLRRRRA